MNSKEIAIFIPSFSIGGVERVMIDIANSITNLGTIVTVIVCKDQGELKDSLNSSIPIISLNSPLRYCLFPLCKQLKKGKYDSILTGPDFPNFIGIIAAKLSGTKVIVTQHNLFNLESQDLGLHGRLTPLLYRMLYPMSNHIITVSDATYDMLIRYGIKSSKLTKISNPINISLIKQLSRRQKNYSPRNDYIVFVGRLSKIKNIPLLLNAFEIVSRTYSNLSLVIVGDGDESESLQNMARSMDSSKILFIGAQSNPYPYISRAKLLCLPSYSEACPCILIEAMALGVTPIITPTTGGMECTDNGNLSYHSTSFTDPHEYAKIIEKGLTAPISKQSLEEYAKKFDIGNISNRYIEILSL